MITVCATGDAMLLQKPPAAYDESGVAGFIKSADVRITNLEAVVSSWDCHASPFCGGQWVNMTPEVFSDLGRFGFNMMSCANNHCMDYSYDGLRSTIRVLENARTAYAGIGSSLADASRPARVQVEGGKQVALISVTSTFIDAARAGDARGAIPARPGLNGLRVKTRYFISDAHLSALKEIADSTAINGERDNARFIGSLPPEPDGAFNFGGIFFELADGNHRAGKETRCDPRDLDRIVGEVEKAASDSDLTIVSVHTHQIRGTRHRDPDYFQEEFAHACIDAGASVVIGGGTHQLKPIELYRGKPVFYSLGNFIFELDKVGNLPDDYWDKYGFNRSLTLQEAQARKTKNGSIGLETVKRNYLSVVPRLVFADGGSLKSAELLPIELGFDDPETKGLPVVADDRAHAEIFDELVEISAPYGTSLEDGELIRISC